MTTTDTTQEGLALPHSPTHHFLVSGATSPLGHRVVELLLRLADVSVSATSRTPEQLIDLAARGARVRRADDDDRASLDAVFAGVEQLLLVSDDAPGMQDLRLGHIRAAVDAAIRAGVQHIVYASIAGADPGSPLAQEHRAAERVIENCGIPFTILRMAPFAESLFARVPIALRFGRWPSSADAGRAAYVARDDAARSAAAALSAGAVESRCLDLTGPEALTNAEVVAACNVVFGANIRLVPMDDEALATALAGAGVELPTVEQVLDMERCAREGRVDTVSDAVALLTRKAPQGLRELLIKHRLDLLLASKNT